MGWCIVIEAGEYIRTNNGRIGKVIKIWNKELKYDSTKYLIDWGNGKATYRTVIKDLKHSNNIIDLIEVGDIIEYIDGDGEYIKDFIIKKHTLKSLTSFIEYLKAYCRVISILTLEKYKENNNNIEYNVDI